jgi:alkylated DNA repair protein (DNA oxidative demethylase)
MKHILVNAIPAGTTIAAPPHGLEYHADFITEAEELSLLAAIDRMEFSEVRMHGIAAKRRVAHYGWVYGYETWRIAPGPPLPEFLHPLRAQVAELLKIEAAALAQVLVTQYPPGAVIGWHRDAPMFGPIVVGVSLLGGCRMRFQRGIGTGRETYSLPLEPRSAYVLSGAARSEWQHSIPPVHSLRYSVTFRTLRAP